MQRTKSDRKYLVLKSEYVNGKLTDIKKEYPDNIAHAKAIIDKRSSVQAENSEFAVKTISERKKETYSRDRKVKYVYEIVNRL